MLVFPSLMGADPLNLAAIITKLEPHCAGFHLDTMDGHLVPTITGGPAWSNAIAQHAQKPCWVHLMVTDPAPLCTQLSLKPGSMVDFQYEASVDHLPVITSLKNKGYKAGLSIAPKTAWSTVESLLPLCDYISIMGVEPGFSGQLYIPETTEKIGTLNRYKMAQKLSFFIACDGGITAELIPTLAQQGVTHVAAASALFSAPDPVVWLQKNNQ